MPRGGGRFRGQSRPGTTSIGASPTSVFCWAIARPLLELTRLPEHLPPIGRWSSPSGEQISDLAADKFLAFCAPSLPAVAQRPLDFDTFGQARCQTRSSSLGPDGLPYWMWIADGESGSRILYRAYQDLLRCIPPSSSAGCTVSPLLAHATHHFVEHSPQAGTSGGARCASGSTRCHAGPRHAHQRLEELSPTHISRLLGDSVPAVVLFDIRSAYPSVEPRAEFVFAWEAFR